MHVRGDTDQFRRFLANDSERLVALADRARAVGAIHHRFGIGDGFVVVIDEWESAEAFQSFLQDEQVAEVMRDSGAQSQPEVEITEAVSSADQF
jgi:hypothetical protein